MLVALAGELAPLAKKLQRPSSTEATVTIARIGLPIMRPSDTEQRHENVVCASVVSYDVNRPSWRLQPRPARLPLVTTRTTKHPALIPHEVPAGARRRTAIPRKTTCETPCSCLEFPPIHAQAASAKPGLSRRRSRVRVPSLP
jgi:hypothetical protein